jgi:hypothetical protein
MTSRGGIWEERRKRQLGESEVEKEEDKDKGGPYMSGILG